MLGYLSLSNTAGIAILDIIHGYDDQVVAQMQGTEKEIEKEKLNPAFFNIVDLPKQKSYFIFGIRKNLLQEEV